MQLYKFPIFMTVFFMLLMTAKKLQAQKDFPHDNSYYETFPDKITGRIFLSQKYVHLNFPASGNAETLEYKSNHKLNLGIGVAYHGFSLNVFYGFPFLNKKIDAKGKTKGIDLQLHLFPNKWAIDLLALFPSGYYLSPKGFAAPNANSYYYRPDLKSTLIGLSVYRVPNCEKFSYRAALIQTEWQKKSAGSILYGGQAHFGIVKGDSALVPTKVQNNYPQAGINKISLFSFGPGIGYAYTWVINKHFFITGSLVGNLDINFSKEKGVTTKNKVSVNPAEVFKTAFGYNSSNWNISATWAGNGLWFKGASSSKNYFWPAGHIRIVIAKRFVTKKHKS